ncbi:basic blue protein-like [Iris pallida]|uniref:Basic blue protein-like n=1 Tax=Iris pallida TaxID=29817 RepID=A0AAX6IJG8_IRIPA|nr:basic blue protein-like [Iris pallida]
MQAFGSYQPSANNPLFPLTFFFPPTGKMAALKAFIAVATVTFAIQSATATNFTVGAPGGSWDLTTNLGSWASAQTFTVGDNLIFSYTTPHDVLEVTKANYDSCGTGSPIASYTSGNDVIPLPAAATRYFICGTAGHCNGGSAGGMKVAVSVVAAAGTPSPPGSSAPPPAAGTPPSPTSVPPPPPPPKKSGANGRGLEAKAAAGFGFGMLMLLAL